MLDSNQKLIDPFFTSGRHNDLDVFIYHSNTSIYLIRIIILFQQTLKEVEHLYRNIAGFDMSYKKFKKGF